MPVSVLVHHKPTILWFLTGSQSYFGSSTVGSRLAGDDAIGSRLASAGITTKTQSLKDPHQSPIYNPSAPVAKGNTKPNLGENIKRKLIFFTVDIKPMYI